MKSTRLVLVAALAATSALTAAAPAPTTAEAEAASCRIDIAYTRQAQIDSRVTVNAEDDTTAVAACVDAAGTAYTMRGYFYQELNFGSGWQQRGNSADETNTARAGAASLNWSTSELYSANDPDLQADARYCVQIVSPKPVTECSDAIVVGEIPDVLN